jgi:hypothetical protein
MRESFYLLNAPAAACTIAGGSTLRRLGGDQGAGHFSTGSGECSTAGRSGVGASVAGGQQRFALTIRLPSGECRVRPESTYTGHCGSRRWTSHLGGKRAYDGRPGKDRSARESRQSIAST